MKKFLYLVMTYVVLAIVMSFGRSMYLKIDGGGDWQFIFAILWGGVGMNVIHAFDKLKDKYVK